MPPRKAAFLLNMLSPYWHDFYRRLSVEGWKVSILVDSAQEPDRSYDDESLAAPSGFTTDAMPGISLDVRRLKLKTQFLNVPTGISSKLDSLSPDVVVSNQLGLRSALALRWARSRGVPFATWANVSPNTDGGLSRLRSAVWRILLSASDRVFTNGTDAQNFLEALGVQASKIVQVPYCLPVNEFASSVDGAAGEGRNLRQNLGLEDRRVFLFVGQFIPRKGLDWLFDAVRTVEPQCDGNIGLVLVGGEPDERIRRQADRLRTQVRFLGFRQPREMWPIWAMADVFVLPSRADEWGIVVNEAAAAGLPLVVSRQASSSVDLIRPGENGWIVDAEEPDSLREAIQEAVETNDQALRQMATSSRRLAHVCDSSAVALRASRVLEELAQWQSLA